MSANIIDHTSFSNMVDILYTYLDCQARENLGSSCRQYYAMHKENQKCLRLAEQLIADYDVHENYPLSRPLWYAVKKTNFFLIGENHTKLEHSSRIFAKFVNSIWVKDKFSILIERPSEDTSPLQNRELAKYLNEEISKTCKGWDSTAEKLRKTFLNSYTRIFFLLSLFLRAQDEIDKEKNLEIINDLIFYTKRFLSKNEWNGVPDFYLLQLQYLIKIMNQTDPTDNFFCNYKYKNAYVMFYLACKIHDITFRYINNINTMLVWHAKERDDSMLAQLENAKKLGNRVVLLAGLAHVDKNSDEYKVIDSLKKRKEFFLVLHPKQEDKYNANLSNISTIENRSNREFLKSFILISVISCEELYKYIAIDPLKVIDQEIKRCNAKYTATQLDFEKYSKYTQIN
jgi:hypothetical protein